MKYKISQKSNKLIRKNSIIYHNHTINFSHKKEEIIKLKEYPNILSSNNAYSEFRAGIHTIIS